MTGMTISDTASWDDLDELEGEGSDESTPDGDTTQGWDDMPDGLDDEETESVNSSPEELDKTVDEKKGAEEKEDKDSKADDKAPEKKGKEGDKEDKEEKDKKDVQDVAPVKGKNIKGTIDGQGLKINTGMTVRVPVDGVKKDVTLQELMNDYSGTKAVEERFSEYGSKMNGLKERESSFDEREGQFNLVLENFNSHMNKAMSEDATTEDLSAPMDFMLDKMGLNVHEYKHKLFLSQFEEFEKLSDMDEVERKLYFAEQENRALRQIESSRYSKFQQASEQQEAEQRFIQFREASNVSDEQYEDAAEDLHSKGYNAEDPEMVVDHANKIYAVERAENILEQIDPELLSEDEVMSEIAELCYSNPRISDKQLIAILKSEYSIEDEDEDLQSPEGYGSVYKRQGASGSNEAIESFDDFNQY